MAFPVVESRSAGVNNTNGTSHTITMPTGITAGDLLVIVFSSDGSPDCTISSGGWKKIGQNSNGVVVTGAIFAKIAAGSDTATVTTSASEMSSHVVLRISGASWINGSSSDGSSTNSDPANHFAGGNPGSTDDFLWVATRSGDSTVVASAAPTNYSNLQSQAAGATGGASTNTAERTLNAQSENPGTFTSNNEQWVSWTLAIGPIKEPGYLVPTAATSGTTQEFTPPANSLLVALVSAADGGLVTVTDSLSGTWTRLARAEASSQTSSGQAEIWVRDIGASPAAMTVSISNSIGWTAMRVRALTGFETVANQTATAVTAENSNTFEITVNAQTVGSLPVTAMAYFTADVTPTLNGSTRETGSFQASPGTDMAGEATAVTSTTGNITLGWTNTGLSSTTGKVAIEILPASSGAHTISMGLITETDTLSAIAPVKDIVKAVGQISETDTPQAMTVVKAAITVQLGLVTETDTPQSMTVVKAPITTSIGLITETDTVSPITPIKNIVKAIGLISETDTTQAFTAVKSPLAANLGLITETDTPLGFAMPKFIAVDQITETDAPLSITPVKSAITVPLGLITETDTQFSITPVKTIVKALGQITETDAPQPMTVVKDTTVQLGLITETDTTFAIVASKPIVKAMGLITETDLTFPIDPGGPKVRHLNPIVETDVLLSITPVKTIFKPLGHLVDSPAVTSGFTALKAPLTAQLGLVVATDLPLPLALTPPPKLGLDFASSSLSVDVAGRFASTSEGRPGSAGGREGTSTVTNVIDV